MMITCLAIQLALAAALSNDEPAAERVIELPARAKGARGGSAFAASIRDLDPREREERIVAEVEAGNVPESFRRFVPIRLRKGNLAGVVYVARDYVAVGSDDDRFLAPMTPYSAQRIADQLGCVLPSTRIVDAIYDQAEVKLKPEPIPPSPAMITVPVFIDHNRKVFAQREGKDLQALTAGHKKDIVITNKLVATPNRVAIYGWHKPDGKPIQPLYAGHTASWADYSHGVRLVFGEMIAQGERKTLAEVLADPKLCALVSDEGPIRRARYDIKEFPLDRK